MWIGPVLLVPTLLSAQPLVEPAGADSVLVDFTMAERGIEWLHQVKAGADVEALRASFRESIAPTRRDGGHRRPLGPVP